MNDQAIFWDKVAKGYASQPIANMDAYEKTLERTLSYLGAEDEVLELGCGTGTTALRLAGAVQAYRASDISPEMIRIGTEKVQDDGPQPDFVAADVFERKLGTENAYDAVLAFNLLHLMDDIPATLARVRDLLRPGGVFIAKTPPRPGSGASLKMRLIVLALPVLQWLGKAPKVTFLTADEQEQAFRNAGFEIVETGDYPARPANHFIVARKPA